MIRANNTPGSFATHGTPCGERSDWIGECLAAVGDGDNLTVSFLPHGQEQAGGLVLNVGEGELNDLSVSHGRGEADQIAAPRIPVGVVRSMPPMIWRISVTVRGRASRRGALP